ncbi:MAG: hypothetical protein ACLP6E_14730 [Acidimicrobiales bacterium]|jgi:hypothetical protein
MRRSRIIAWAGVLALSATPMLLVGPMVGSAAGASGNHGAVVPAVVAKVSVSPTSGPRGTSVTAKGKGYQSGEQVKVYYRTNRHLPNPERLLICTATVTAHGKFSCTGNIPTAHTGPLGSHEIQAIGQTSGTSAETPFMLT